VGYDVYTIETKITKKGAELKAKRLVPKRAKLTRKKRWELLDEDLGYSGKQLDRDVVNPSQIRKVIRTFKEKLPEIGNLAIIIILTGISMKNSRAVRLNHLMY